MKALIDSSVVVDYLSPDSPWHEWAARTVHALAASGPVSVNAVILAEVSAGFSTPGEVDRKVPAGLFGREDLPCSVSFAAGQAFARYRRAGGTKASPLPDFLIGAHADVVGAVLVTRDVRRIRTYFPDVQVITPDA